MSSVTAELKEFLEENHDRYNRTSFIQDDPVSIPHLFTIKEDIEVSALLTSVIAWGQRKTICRNAGMLMERMDMSPAQFVKDFSKRDLKATLNFRHRTFQPTDLASFLLFLRNIYKTGGLERVFFPIPGPVLGAIENCRDQFIKACIQKRSHKHFPSPAAGSAAKRMNLFLRWMIRRDKRGVDFGIWNYKMMPDLMCPLDLHSGRVARMLGLLKRKQNDWRAVEELTNNLRMYDASDPVKYDFALFGPGVNEKTRSFSKEYTRK